MDRSDITVTVACLLATLAMGAMAWAGWLQ